MRVSFPPRCFLLFCFFFDIDNVDVVGDFERLDVALVVVVIVVVAEGFIARIAPPQMHLINRACVCLFSLKCDMMSGKMEECVVVCLSTFHGRKRARGHKKKINNKPSC